MAKLQQADIAEVNRKAKEEREAAERQTEQRRRAKLAEAARDSLRLISNDLKDAIRQASGSAEVLNDNTGGWVARLGGATLDFAPAQTESRREWNNWRIGFDVIAYSSVSLSLPANTYEYGGRSHSLWYCDASEEGEYNWYEVGFMDHVLMRSQSKVYPYALPPGEKSAKALSRAMSEYDVGRRFLRLVPGDLDEFCDSWLDRFGEAAGGGIPMPNQMPDGERGSWRQADL